MRFLPITAWVKGYDKANLRFDLVAGLTLAAFAVPESLAYASLAGLPPAAGLYAGIAAMLMYAVFGSSSLLAVGVTSALAVLTAGTIGGLAHRDVQHAAVMAAFATLVAAAAAFVARLFRLGFLANLVSRSVLTGFSTGAGIFIASTQLAKLFGVKSEGAEFYERLRSFFHHVGEMHGLTLAIGLGAMALLFAGRRFLPKAPNPLIIVGLALGASALFGLADHGVKIVGDIPRGLPTPSLPVAALDAWQSLVPLGLSIFVLSYVEGVSAARSLAAKHGGHVDANQELIANGAANLLSGLLRGMPVGGSLTRSSVNVESGAKTPLSGAVGGVLLIVVVAFLTGVFRALPEAVLAAIILVSVTELVEIAALKRLWVLSKRELLIAALTGLGVLVFGMLGGVIIGVLVSLLDLLERATFPHTAELGQIPGTNEFGDRQLHPENREVDGVLALRIDASLVFANAHTVKDDVLAKLAAHVGPPIRLLVLDLESSPLMDLSGVDMLEGLRAHLAHDGIELSLAGVRGEQRHLLRAVQPETFGKLKPGHDVGAVVRAWTARPPRTA